MQETKQLIIDLQSFQEAGRVLSAANEKKIKDAVNQLQTILNALMKNEKVDEQKAEKTKKEAKEVIDKIQKESWPSGNHDHVGHHYTEQIEESFVPLAERAVRADGTIPIKIIEPGWGSSGYYPREVLMRDAHVYKEGTKMYWDHPTPTEERERPERSLRDLAGVLVSSGRWEEFGPDGPGVYADAKVFDPFRENMDELAPYIGISHRATGRAEQGEAEGRRGPIIQEIRQAQSVDFVTDPGAGGKIIELMESIRKRSEDELKWEDITLEAVKKNRPEIIESLRAEIKGQVYGDKGNLQESIRQKDGEIQKLQEAKEAAEKENKRLKESLVLRESRDFVMSEMKDVQLPEITKQRLAESLAKEPVVDDKGELDKEKYKTKVQEAVKAEAEYLSKVTGSGSIKGFSESGTFDGSVTVSDEEIEKTLQESFAALGLDEESAKLAAKGRV